MSIFRMAYVVDTVRDRSLIPDEVHADIVKMWEDFGHGNDYYYHDMSWDMSDYRASTPEEREDFTYHRLMSWLDTMFPIVDEKTPVLIHFWW